MSIWHRSWRRAPQAMSSRTPPAARWCSPSRKWPPPDPYDDLRTRERVVLQLVAEGFTNHQIAEMLKLSIKTVKTHRLHLMQKLDLHDRTELVKYAFQKG